MKLLKNLMVFGEINGFLMKVHNYKMILLTGGSGLLGTELQKHMRFITPARRLGYDIRDPRCWRTPTFNERNKHVKYDLIVHCAAYTDLVKAETEKHLCYETNVIGTRNLASLRIPMLYISTEYVFDGEKGNYEETDFPNPKNFYAFTKLLGEYEARATRSVVVRCLFKPRPFKHPAACVDMFTTGDYVDVIAKEIIIAIKNFNQLPSTIHIGTGKKSTFELARQTRAVEPISVDSITSVKLPKDTSLNTTKWEDLKCRLILQEQNLGMKK